MFFFLWPIGRDDNRLSRMPRVTIAILALNVLVFTFTFAMQGGIGAQAETAVQSAIEYYLEHPHLRLSEALTDELPDEWVSAIRGRARELRARAPRPPDWRLSQYQTELDSLVKIALRNIDKIGRSYAHRWGFIASQPRPSRVLTSMFLHAGWEHLLGNLFILYLSGPFIEAAFGGWIYGAIYLLGGVSAAFFQYASSPTAEGPMLGASGAVFAIIGAFLVRFFKARLKFFYFVWLIRVSVGTFRVPAFVIIPFLFLRELADAATNTQSGVAHWAHVGGFAFGFAAALAVRSWKLDERFAPPPEGDPTLMPRHPGLDRAIAARAAGELEHAHAHLRQVLRERPAEADTHLELFHTLLALGRAPQAEQSGGKYLAMLVKRGEVEAARFAFDEMLGFMPHLRPPPTVLLAFGRLAESEGRPEDAVMLYERLAAQHQTSPIAAKGLLRAAELDAVRGEPTAAIESLRRALHIPLDPGVREGIERRMAEIASLADLPLPAVPQAHPKGAPPPVQGPR